MRVIDLSHKIHFNMTVYTEETRPSIKEIANIKEDGYNEKSISIFSHTGTHMDSPRHMIKDGKSLYEFNMDKFIGDALLIDVSNLKNENITVEILKKYKSDIQDVEFIIFKTGLEKWWNSKEYFLKFPTLTEQAAIWLLQFNLKGIGVDAISVDCINSLDFNIHNILFSKEMVIIENLANLPNIKSNKFLFCATPLKYEDADGSPVRAIAIIN